jgi:small-conductance mechanosensitive channel
MQPFQFIAELWSATPAWVLTAIDVVLCVLVALALHYAAYRALGRFTRSAKDLMRPLIKRTYGPTRLTFVAIALAYATSTVPLTYGQLQLVQHLLVLCSIALIAWVAWLALTIWLGFHLRRFESAAPDDFLARKHVTQTQILQRIAAFLIWFGAVAAMLMTFDGVRQYGISLLASAGAAGIILGLSLQPVLKNLVAGIQIAVTQPIKIGDSLIVEGDYGTVEDITATYVVIRTWDLRRLVVPLSYFIEQPFQNWTRQSTNLLGTAMFYLDYSTPVAALREKAKAIVEDSALWDRNVFAVQVTDFRERTMEIRVLVSASTSGRLFELRCLVREALITYLQTEHPQSLPRTRTELGGGANPGSHDVEAMVGGSDHTAY